MEREQNIGIDASIFSAIRGKAARLIGACGFSAADRADLQQELVFDCLSRLRKFDPTRSSHRTFLHRVVGHRVATLVDAQRAACRDYRLCRDSLDAPIPVADSDLIALGETVSGDAYEARMGRSARSARERSELRIDVDSVISRLPPELAAVAVLLKSEGVVEVGRRLGISRATTYRRLIRIREVFAAAGLDSYLRQFQPRCSPPGFQAQEDANYRETGRVRPTRTVGLEYRRRRGINATSVQRLIQTSTHDEATGGDLAGTEERALSQMAMTFRQRTTQRKSLEERNA